MESKETEERPIEGRKEKVGERRRIIDAVVVEVTTMFQRFLVSTMAWPVMYLPNARPTTTIWECCWMTNIKPSHATIIL